jgi:hypothetical protein
MLNEVVKTLMSADGQRRVQLLRRSNGTFGFTELEWLPDEKAWTPCGNYSEAFCDSLERVEREARGRVAWLAEAERGG